MNSGKMFGDDTESEKQEIDTLDCILEGIGNDYK